MPGIGEANRRLEPRSEFPALAILIRRASSSRESGSAVGEAELQAQS
jgi:hypothetical protein